MAVAVVDSLEMVDVNHHHHGSVAEALAPLELACNRFLPAHPVEQARQPSVLLRAARVTFCRRTRRDDGRRTGRGGASRGFSSTSAPGPGRSALFEPEWTKNKRSTPGETENAEGEIREG